MCSWYSALHLVLQRAVNLAEALTSSLSLQSLAYLLSVRALTLSLSLSLPFSFSLSLHLLQYAVLGQEAGAGDWWSDEDIWWSPAAQKGKLSFTCAAFLVAMNVLICRIHLCEHLHSVTLSAHSMCRVMAGCASGSWAIRCIYQVCKSECGLYLSVSGAPCHCYLSMHLSGFSCMTH